MEEQKNFKTFEDFLNEAADPSQSDLKRVIKTMKENRDEFQKMLNKHKKELTDTQIRELEERIKFLDDLINKNSSFLTGTKGSKPQKGMYDWTQPFKF
jgi:MinD superfamily P-loop ATPase